MSVFGRIWNYICYCGIERDEYNALKKDAYVSNYGVWRILHCLMVAVFGVLFINSYLSGLLLSNRTIYLFGLVYSVLATVCFFVLKKDSLIAQFLIYLSISLLFLFGCLISRNRPDSPATTFVVLLLISPMFMIDKPYFMSIELCVASAVFLIWMHGVKPFEVWKMDLANVIVFTLVGILLHIVANSIRIKEFVLTRTIALQKDRDELTGLKNKDALTRAINEYLADDETDKGVMFILDIDRFKAINDTYGHDVGDNVIHQLGIFLSGLFPTDEIVGRFGGDEFIVFLKGTDDPAHAREVADRIITGASAAVKLPEEGQQISVSIGASVYHGHAKNYSELFKKADTAMYRAKADPENRFCLNE